MVELIEMACGVGYVKEPRISWRPRSSQRRGSFGVPPLRVWPGGVMVRVLVHDKGCGFNSRPFHFQETTLGKSFTHMCLYHEAV